MITLEELWYAWRDIDERTEVHLAFDKVMIILKG